MWAVKTRKFITRLSLFLTLLLLCNPGTYAQTPQPFGIDILKKGVFVASVSSRIPDENLPGGFTISVRGRKYVEETSKIAARIGVQFGYDFVLTGAPIGAMVPLKFITIFPAQGLQDPKRGVLYRAELVQAKAIGTANGDGYQFDYDWELVPGEWKFQIWYQDRMMSEESFTVTRSGSIN
jgi:Domain of unknown function (DUF3859)